MKIQSGTVAMQSNRVYHSSQQTNKVTAEAPANGGSVILTVSNSKSEIYEQSGSCIYGDYTKMLPDQSKRKDDYEIKFEKEVNSNGENEAGIARLLTNNTGAAQMAERAKSKEEMQLEVLRKLIASLRSMQGKGDFKYNAPVNLFENQYASAEYNKLQFSEGTVRVIGQINGLTGEISTNANNGTVWQKSTIESSFMEETENTAYSAQGIVKTADGRSIGFNVQVEMSRSFCAEYESITNESYIVTDPLVINFDTDNVSVTDQKFLFDLDSDGEEEEISFVGKGSGFLALDKNGDGVINDGSELFGTKSGDGFKDLAQYDDDGNGWIDESDEVFNRLRIWTKNEKGEDELIDLKKAGVGAIYLSGADTKFSLNDSDTNETNAIVRKTGIYLKESGEAGTINHLDLVL